MNRTSGPVANLRSRRATASNHNMSDISLLLPPHFTGSRDQDPVRWLQQFKRYAAFKNLKEEQILGMFPLLLRGYALDWLDSLNEN